MLLWIVIRTPTARGCILYRVFHFIASITTIAQNSLGTQDGSDKICLWGKALNLLWIVTVHTEVKPLFILITPGCGSHWVVYFISIHSSLTTHCLLIDVANSVSKHRTHAPHLPEITIIESCQSAVCKDQVSKPVKFTPHLSSKHKAIVEFFLKLHKHPLVYRGHIVCWNFKSVVRQQNLTLDLSQSKE